MDVSGGIRLSATITMEPAVSCQISAHFYQTVRRHNLFFTVKNSDLPDFSFTEYCFKCKHTWNMSTLSISPFRVITSET